MFGLNKQDGNASILVVMLGALGLAGVLNQSQESVTNRLKASKVKKSLLEGQESGLQALSVTKQLVSVHDLNLPAIGFKNPVNPNSSQDVAFQSLEVSPNPNFTTLSATGALAIAVPDIAKYTAQEMDGIFQSRNPDANAHKNTVNVRPISWEPFSTGYGIKNLFVEADTSLHGSGTARNVSVRAKIPIAVPQGRCSLVVTRGGSPLTSGATIPAGSQVDVNLHCQGVVLYAQLLNKGQVIRQAGPVTAANNYKSDIPMLLQPTQIQTLGNHSLEGQWRLVDGTLLTTSTFVLTIASPANPLICRKYCNCVITGAGQGCPANEQYIDPYANLPKSQMSLPASLPMISGNPQTSPADRAILTRFASAHGLSIPTVNWQGVAFPDYPNVLVCLSDTGGLFAFDPNNNCSSRKISMRGTLGCLREGARITIKPGFQIAIEHLRPGDTVWNPIKGQKARIAKVTAGPEHKALVLLKFDDRSLAVTESHPMRTPQGYQRADALKVGDLLLVEGKWQSLAAQSLDARHPGETVWNLEFDSSEDEDMRAFEAEGVVVGDLSLQHTMENGPNK